MKQYRTWLKVEADGSISESVWCLGDPPEGFSTLCTDKELEGELRKNGGTNLYHDGQRLQRRTPLRWISSMPSAAVGETIRLELAGLPDGYRDPISVIVGEERYRLEHPYAIELGWENPARVGIQVDEPALVQTSSTHVQFLERRQKL